MIRDCDHEPKIAVRSGATLSVCAACQAHNASVFHRGDSVSWNGMRHYPPVTYERRRRTYRILDLHRPTHEDLG